MKNWLWALIVAAIIAVGVVVPANAKNQQQELQDWRDYAAKLEEYHATLDRDIIIKVAGTTATMSMFA